MELIITIRFSFLENLSSKHISSNLYPHSRKSQLTKILRKLWLSYKMILVGGACSRFSQQVHHIYAVRLYGWNLLFWLDGENVLLNYQNRCFISYPFLIMFSFHIASLVAILSYFSHWRRVRRLKIKKNEDNEKALIKFSQVNKINF